MNIRSKKIQRWEFDRFGEPIQDRIGRWVKYSDHQKKIRDLRGQHEQKHSGEPLDIKVEPRRVMHGSHFSTSPRVFHFEVVESQFNCAWAGCTVATDQDSKEYKLSFKPNTKRNDS